MKSVIGNAIFKSIFSSARLFSSLGGRVPAELAKKISKSFEENFGSAAIRVKLDKKAINKSADQMLQWLSGKVDVGCLESSAFLQTLNNFKDPKSVALYLEGVPHQENAAEYFSHLIAATSDRNLSLTSKTKISEKGGGVHAVGPHCDGSKHGAEVALTILSGLDSDGKVRTYTLDINRLHAKLSEKSKEILAEKIFLYSQENPMEFNDSSFFQWPILYKDESDILRVNFSYDSRNLLLCDYGGTRFSEKEVNQAVEELYRNVERMYKSEEVESFFLRTGSALIIKNKQVLHGRDGESENNRDIGFCSYGPSTVFCSTESLALNGGIKGFDKAKG